MEFMKEKPGDSFVKHALALEYIKLGNDVEAGKLFITLLENDPGYIGSYYHLGKLRSRIHHRLGQRTKASPGLLHRMEDVQQVAGVAFIIISDEIHPVIE